MDFSNQVRGARAMLKWTREDLAKASGLSIPTIKNVEDDESPTEKTKQAITVAINNAGYAFTTNGVEQRDFAIHLHDNYMSVLDDIEKTLQNNDEILFHCADDARSSDDVTAKMAQMRRAGLKMRSTICAGNTEIKGNINDYRWIDPNYFANADVIVIYEDKHVLDLSNEKTERYMIVQNRKMSDVLRRQFEYWWSVGKKVGS